MTKENKKPKNKVQIEGIKNAAQEAWTYSIRRMDLLIISIGGAGVYVILETLKQVYLTKPLDCIWVLKVAGVLFVLAIILNFISQWTGMKANESETLRCEEELAEDCNDKKAFEYQLSAKSFNSWTIGLNSASMIVMFIGLMILAIYYMAVF